MGGSTVDLKDVDATQVAVVGGKGARLGELMRLDGLRVPAGFCVVGDAASSEIAARVRDGVAYAVRSSATAEDGVAASFAGQHDSFLGVVGADAVVSHVASVRESLSSSHAAAYRARAGVEGAVAMAVVVQEMVDAYASGVLFTADPVSGRRDSPQMEAVAGLGDALVSGREAPQHVLTSAQVLELEEIGRRIEAHFGSPQDIEWCLDADGFAIVQSRPITTLFPIPAAADDAPHVYVSVGHQQMMTDAMKPLGLSLWQLTAIPPMHEAAGRLFVDVASRLASPTSREATLDMLGTSDPLFGDALRTVVSRGFVPPVPDAESTAPAFEVPPAPPTDPAVVTALIARSEEALGSLRARIAGVSGADLFAFIREDLIERKRLLLDHPNRGAIMAGMEAAWWLNEKLEEWLGERGAVDTLTLSAPGNVTSEMGLELLDVADAVRASPETVAYLSEVSDDDFIAGIPDASAREALEAWLGRYGMRCVAEIDITRPRWAERPSSLIPLILANVRNFEPGEARRRFDRGVADAEAFEADVLTRLRALPDGSAKADETAENIKRVRVFAGYREYPKYDIVCRSREHKKALTREIATLGFHDPDDADYLRFEELEEVARSGVIPADLIASRRATHRHNETLTPPRVLLSTGEMLHGSYGRTDVPEGALVGLAVSRGVVEGRARVVLDVVDADLEPGDILVTKFTDPSWSPLFLTIRALVTEVGGLMTHGAVIAREYGLPAVVGVGDATTLIEDGQPIRVHGTDGYVEVVGARLPPHPRG